MSKKLLSLLALSVLLTGCGLHAQTYVMTKDRVNIEKGSGNAGYLTGTPQYVEPQRKTRKVYILEITKAVPESEAKKIQQEVDSAAAGVDTKIHEPVAPQAESTHESAQKIVIPPIDETAAPAKEEKPQMGPTEDVSYTIQKDDTLQKIAKKYYGSHNKWLKIYNANKEKLKNNPNLLKAGTVITIPAVDKK